MPSIEFLASDLGPTVIEDAPDGGRLLDLCDDARAPVAFSCRSASCGACRVDILEGASLLAPPADDEREVLRAFASPASHRLACVACALPGGGRVSLRWVDPARCEPDVRRRPPE